MWTIEFVDTLGVVITTFNWDDNPAVCVGEKVKIQGVTAEVTSSTVDYDNKKIINMLNWESR